MAGSLNRVMLIGNLGADPEIRRTAAGNPIATFRIATSESWRDKNSGERKEKTEWHTIVVFNENLAKVAEQYLKKGSKVYVEGQLATRRWEDRDGKERFSTEIVLQNFRGEIQMLDKLPSNRPPGAEGPDDYGLKSGRDSGRPASQTSPGVQDLDDEIPF